MIPKREIVLLLPLGSNRFFFRLVTGKRAMKFKFCYRESTLLFFQKALYIVGSALPLTMVSKLFFFSIIFLIVIIVPVNSKLSC